MNQEFISSYGKVINERKILFIKILKPRLSSDSWMGQWLWALLPVIAIGISLFDNNVVKKYVSVIFWTLLFWGNLKQLFELLFKRSFATRIPLSRITSYEIKQDEIGLETFVHLRLRSGRIRIIAFRTLEKQVEPFTELVSQHIAQPQLA